MPSIEPSAVPRRIGAPYALEVFLGRHQALDLLHHHRARGLVLEIANDLAEAEHAHRDDDEADAVGELRQIERKARAPEFTSVPRRSQQQAEHDHADGMQ